MNNSLQNIAERVRTFTLDSLVEKAICRITKNPSVEQPWVLLSFLEITYRECDNNQLKFKATYNDFDNICQQLFELMNSHPLSNFIKHHPKKLFHVLAYQQFPYQHIGDHKDIERQQFLFNAENSNSKLSKRLINEYGFTVSEFLTLWNDIMSRTRNDSSQSIADKLLEKISINHNDVKEEIQSFSNGVGNDFFKTFVADFFVKYPFIHFNNQRFCIDKQLLTRTINEFLFERTLEWPETKATFDNRFQLYINESLKVNQIEYKTDTDLKSEGQKECDFFIQNFLFAECKAIKLKPLAQANPSDQILKNNLQHIIKAYEQIISTANRNKCPIYFGAIITYLPFYFSDGSDIWDIIKAEINEYLRENKLDLLIGPDRLFFIDIKSWDKLIDYVVRLNHRDSLKQIFQNAYKTNKSSPKFEFSMHLD